MKAIRVHSYGHSDQLKLEDADTPKIKEDEVLVRVHAAGVNPVDWKIREGFLKDFRPQAFPFIPGQDIAGEIADVGSRTLNFKKGDQVFGMVWGAYAEYASARPEWLARKPKSLSYDEAAAVPLAALTAWQALEAAQVRGGQRILIHGAAGGVGSFATQIARWMGVRVTATAAAYDEAYLRSLGVDTIIDYHKERFEDKTRGVDAVIDLVGGQTLERSYGVVRRGGCLVTTLGEVDQDKAAAQGIRAVAMLVGMGWLHLELISRLIDDGVIKPRLDQVLPLEQARRAQDMSQEGKTHGKVVLRVA